VSTMQHKDVDLFLLSGDPIMYNSVRECRIIRTVHDVAGRAGWLVGIEPSLPLLRFLESGATETIGETAHLVVFGDDPNRPPVVSSERPTRVGVYAITSISTLNDGILSSSNSVLYPPTLLHDSREAALKYLNPMSEQRIRDWVKDRGPR